MAAGVEAINFFVEKYTRSICKLDHFLIALCF